nr:galactose oxidase [Thermoproteota archaeon]
PSVNVNEMYDPAQDKWRILETMPSERSGIAAASPVNSTIIYVFGGEEPSKTFNNNEKYDSKTGEWMSEPPMPTARHGLGAAPYEDRIYVIGGGPQPGLSVSDVNEIYHIG